MFDGASAPQGFNDDLRLWFLITNKTTEYNLYFITYKHTLFLNNDYWSLMNSWTLELKVINLHHLQ